MGWLMKVETCPDRPPCTSTGGAEAVAGARIGDVVLSER
jgi:hypothetical protein